MVGENFEIPCLKWLKSLCIIFFVKKIFLGWAQNNSRLFQVFQVFQSRGKEVLLVKANNFLYTFSRLWVKEEKEETRKIISLDNDEKLP